MCRFREDNGPVCRELLQDPWFVLPEDDRIEPDAPDWEITQRPGYAASFAADGIMLVPAISGGSPEADVYHPTEADWAEYRRSFDAIESDMGFPQPHTDETRREFQELVARTIGESLDA